jgi:uracil-DNA glycosylase
MQLINELNAMIADCRQCPLHETRKNTVPGEGNLEAGIFFVGEGPGADEDEQGRPFVGRSGQLLTTMLNHVGIERSEVFIGNIVKCRPPGNRDPMPVEVEECRAYLQAQISIVRPKVIVTLGAPALSYFFESRYKLGSVVGRFIRNQGQLYYAMWHPSYVLRLQKLKTDYIRHFKRLRARMDQNFE